MTITFVGCEYTLGFRVEDGQPDTDALTAWFRTQEGRVLRVNWDTYDVPEGFWWANPTRDYREARDAFHRDADEAFTWLAQEGRMDALRVYARLPFATRDLIEARLLAPENKLSA